MEYDANNRLLTYNGETVTYDADGNMIHGPLNGVMTDFAYDCRNRLIQAGDTIYTYDAENHRIAVETKTSVTRYVVDSQPELTRILQAVETDKATGESRTTYYTYGTGLLAQEEAQTGYQLYHFNHLGSTTLITGESGQVIQTFEYNPYGELLDGAIGTYRFLFNGEYGVVTDVNGLYYMRARYYNVDIKRFMNQDVIVGSVENSPSLNRYAYVEGNPVNYLDPFGLEKWGDEFAKEHIGLGNASYVFSVLAALAVVFPPLELANIVSNLITGADLMLHWLERDRCDVGSEKYIEHTIWIVIDLLSLIPGFGTYFGILFFIENELEKEKTGMEIPQKIAEEISLWRYLYGNDIITFEDIFSPEAFEFEVQYGGRH